MGLKSGQVEEHCRRVIRANELHQRQHRKDFRFRCTLNYSYSLGKQRKILVLGSDIKPIQGLSPGMKSAFETRDQNLFVVHEFVQSVDWCYDNRTNRVAWIDWILHLLKLCLRARQEASVP